MEQVRVCEIPSCKMVSSGVGMFGDENFALFERFMSLPKLTPRVFPRDYLYWEGEWGVSGGFCWLYIWEEGMEVPEGLAIIDFKGGLYAVVTGIDAQSNAEEMKATEDFIRTHGFKHDPSRPELGNVVTPKAARQAMGYSQMDYFTPIKVKE